MTATKLNAESIDTQKLLPIPALGESVNAARYRDVPVDAGSQFYSEPLVDLRDYRVAGLSFYHISDGSNPPYCQQLDGSIPAVLARKSVAEMLARVNLRLEALGLELLVWDAYRPLATQKGIWNFFWRDIKSKNPSFSDKEIYDEVIGYVSDPNNFDPDDSRTWPTHMTGASVDLTIRRKADLHLLDMGAEFDQMDMTAHTIHFERLLANGEIQGGDARLENRRLLFSVMTEQGFTNYPLEYWHFDWGNQMHSFIRSLSAEGQEKPAHYGIV